MKSLRIIVDNRERNLTMQEELVNLGVEINFAQLPVGDYILSDRVCIERKTVQDFEKSIIDNRLFEQTKRLSLSFNKPIILIEGDESEFRLGENVILGAMLKIYHDFNIQVIRSRDALQTAVILAKFAEKEQIPDAREPRLTGMKKAFSDYERKMMILEMLPGIGPQLAKRLLGHFGSVRGVISASADELCEVEKIGKKKAERIHSLANGSE